MPRAVTTVLAFDFGLKRVGLACGDTLTRSAAPRAAILAGKSGPDWEAIEREVRALIASEPALAAHDTVTVPYVTYAYRLKRTG